MRRTVLLVALAAVLNACGLTSAQPPPLTPEQQSAIVGDLRGANYPEPKSLEVSKDGGFVVAIFEVTPSQIPDGGEAFATDALLKIREKLLPSGSYKNFRVTINAPSQYTGMVNRYGSARLVEGGRVNWQQGK
jgi:hypothetical protein